MFVAVETRSRTMLEVFSCILKENSVLKANWCANQLKASFSIKKCVLCVSMRHYSASPEFSNRPQTPVSAVGCCSLLNGGSSSFIALTVNESIKDLTDFRQDPLHHSPRWWNELWSLVWGEEASWVWAFFSIIEISYTYGSHQSLSVTNLLNIVYVCRPERTRQRRWDTTLMFSVICFKHLWSNCLSSSDVKWLISPFVGATA